MHYPVMTEKHVADRWQVSLKTLRRWRLDGEVPVWHKLFRHVRYHEADILKFEHRSAQHLMTLLGINREFKAAEPDATLDQGLDAEAGSHSELTVSATQEHFILCCQNYVAAHAVAAHAFLRTSQTKKTP